jgi:hypothetical protein
MTAGYVSSGFVIACAAVLLNTGGRASESRSVQQLRPQNPDRGCMSAILPSALAGADVLVDSASIMTSLRVAPPEHAVISIVVTDLDNSEHVSRIPESQSQDADSLRSLIAAHLRSVSTIDAPWGARLILTTGPTLAMSLAPAVYCEAKPGERDARATTTRVMTDAEIQDLQSSRPFIIRMWITAKGTVARAVFVQSTGNSTRDNDVITSARNRRMVPATLDGVPISSVYDFRSDR